MYPYTRNIDLIKLEVMGSHYLRLAALANCLDQFYRLRSKVFCRSWKGFFQKIAHKIRKKFIDQKLHIHIKICIFKFLHWRPTTCLVDTISYTVNGRWIPTKEKKWKEGDTCSPPWPPAGVTRDTDDGMTLKRQLSYWETRESTQRLALCQLLLRTYHELHTGPSAQHRKLNRIALSTNAGARLLGAFILPLPLICCVT